MWIINLTMYKNSNKFRWPRFLFLCYDDESVHGVVNSIKWKIGIFSGCTKTDCSLKMFPSCWLFFLIVHFDFCCLNFHFRYQFGYVALIFQLLFHPCSKELHLSSPVSFPLTSIFQSTRWWV